MQNKFPRAVDAPVPKGVSGGLRAQTNTFGFGPLDPGEQKTIVWRLTAVEAGTYTLHYRVEAGLDGKAKAVTADGGEVKGEFVVTISDKAPKATVNNKGQVVTQGRVSLLALRLAAALLAARRCGGRSHRRLRARRPRDAASTTDGRAECGPSARRATAGAASG